MTSRKGYVGGLDCYVIEMKFKGYGDDASSHAPAFFRTFTGADVSNGKIGTGDITQAYRFPTEHSAAITARHLLHNPTVCNETRNSYEVYIRKLECGVAKRAILEGNNLIVVSD